MFSSFFATHSCKRLVHALQVLFLHDENKRIGYFVHCVDSFEATSLITVYKDSHCCSSFYSQDLTQAVTIFLISVMLCNRRFISNVGVEPRCILVPEPLTLVRLFARNRIIDLEIGPIGR